MKKWPEHIEALRPYVHNECRDIPPDLILAIIQNESDGVVGVPAGRPARSPGDVPTLTGKKFVDRAYGLMQTIPAVVAGYNKATKDPQFKATWEDISGTDERAARIQIRLGCFFLGRCNAWLHNNYPNIAPAASLSNADMNQIRLALTAYAIGPGNLKNKLDILAQQGKPQTFDQLKISFPDWGKIKSGPNAGKWANRPLHYGTKVGNKFEKHDHYNQRPGTLEKLTTRATGALKGGGGLLMVALLIGGGWKVYKHYKEKKSA